MTEVRFYIACLTYEIYH